jgi:hypothetical protein
MLWDRGIAMLLVRMPLGTDRNDHGSEASFCRYFSMLSVYRDCPLKGIAG